MDEYQVIKLVRIAIQIMLAKGEKTISPASIQTAVRTMYIDDEEIGRQLISSGTIYLTRFTSGHKIKINSFNQYNKLVREHIGSGIYNEIYKVSANTIPYLCGVVDKANNQVQQF